MFLTSGKLAEMIALILIGLVVFYGISTFVRYLMQNPLSLCVYIYIYIYIYIYTHDLQANRLSYLV